MKRHRGLSLLATLCAVLCAVLYAGSALAQQTGSITGKVTLPDGAPAPGVTVEARAEVLPQARTTVTGANGDYQLPLLPPGRYTVDFTLEGMDAATRQVQVFLQQTAMLDVTMGVDVAETIEVIDESPLVDRTSSEIKSAVSTEVIEQVPVGQDYRDLVKLIPGVQYSEDTIRGPSAGGSGQDNVYQFDGVNVTVPLFGTLSAEPSSHDIEQISIVKGGASAEGFNRSGGFSINSISRSGTNEWKGQVSYQVQTDSMTADRDTGSDLEFEQDNDWTVANLGGPLVAERLFAYASYYRPTEERDNRSNLYGSVPKFESVRDEFFGKLTYTPSAALLLHGSYRTSEREDSGTGVTTESRSGTTSRGEVSELDIAILEGTWVIADNQFLSARYTDFENPGTTLPDRDLGFPIAIDGSVRLDVANLDQQGELQVPVPVAGQDAFNAFIAPIIDRYGFVDNGVRTGGGFVGADDTFDVDDFYREAFEVGYDYWLGDNVTHELHAGYQWQLDEEDRAFLSNGWGRIEVIGGRQSFNGQPVIYQARFQQMSLGDALVPIIHSELESQNIELNDTIRWGDWTFNAGVLLSQDTFYGQGLRENSSNLSGFELAPGHKYEMYDIGFDEMIQPRLGATWAYNGQDTVYANLARYYPLASSLPRAASWDRNLAREIRAYFDAAGNLIGVDPIASSSGKFFADDLDPRAVDEVLLGTSQQVSPRLAARAYARYRYGYNFWEDTNNDARLRFNPPAGIPQELYIPELAAYRAEIGGSTYVIAELDNAFTKFWEVSTEAEWRGANAFLRGSYVWSHYYGNFDQDNTTTVNDANSFIGSSFIGDGNGSQLWDNRYGNLRGDRRHQFKVYGFYNFDWNGGAGLFAVYQSGQPWEAWSGTSVYAEGAGSRTTDDHYQVDLNYTQNFPFADRYNLQLSLDVFNVTDNQTGYNIQNRTDLAGFSEPRSFFDPRRLQLAARFQF